MLSLDPVELQQHLNRPGFFAHIFELTVGGDTHRGLARDVQFDPVSDRAIHVDFMRFSATTRIEVAVVVHFLNEEASPGLKMGGVLNIVRHEVDLVCSPENIPEFLTVDLTGLDIGDSVHISSVALPEGVRPTITDRDFTIATIAAPTVMTAEEEAAETAGGEDGAAEGDADAEKKGDGEDGEKADSE